MPPRRHLNLPAIWVVSASSIPVEPAQPCLGTLPDPAIRQAPATVAA